MQPVRMVQGEDLMHGGQWVRQVGCEEECPAAAWITGGIGKLCFVSTDHLHHRASHHLS
jgi:hypothetical protein